MDKPAIAHPPESRTPAFSIWQLLGLLAGPLLFLFVYFLVRPDGMPPAATAVLAGTAWVATWLITGAVPLPVATLLPLVLFPLLGVATMSEAAAPYATPTVFLALGGCLVAVAMERWNLHRRIALSVIALAGASPARLVLGFLAGTALLSLGLSTAATVVITLPLGLAVITQMTALQKRAQQKVVAIGGGIPRSDFGTALVLSLAYGASFGPAGTGWVAVPATFLSVACGWLILRLVCSPEPKAMPGARPLVGQELSAMGRISTREKWALAVFAAVTALWMIRPYLITPYLPLVDDATIAMFGGLLLFLIPTNLQQNQWLLTTDALQKVPWGILLLFGAGLTIAAAAQSSGLWQWLTGSLPPRLAGMGMAASTAMLGLVVTAALASAFERSASIKLMVRAGVWLCIAGAAISAFCTYVWPGV